MPEEYDLHRFHEWVRESDGDVVEQDAASAARNP